MLNILGNNSKILYQSFANTLRAKYTIDLCIYNNDFSLFKKLIKAGLDSYSHYVIIPHLTQKEETMYRVLNLVSSKQLILIDKAVNSIQHKCSSVIENFEGDIYMALQDALPKLQKYRSMQIIFPLYSHQPKEILSGCINFCREHGFEYAIINDIAKEGIEKGSVYLNLCEETFVALIEKIGASKKMVGKDIGIISYGETPIKKVVLGGITTVSSDYSFMGKKAAELILNGKQKHVSVPFHLTLRNSI